MATATKTQIKIDPELQQLLFPLKPDEYASLEKQILDDGCKTPLVIWAEKGVLVDGHNRLSICTEHGIEYECEARSFASLDEVKAWMIEHQLARRNLSPDQASYLRGIQYREMKKAHGGAEFNPNGRKGKEPSGHFDHSVKTEEVVAAKHKVSPKTIRRDAKYAQAVDAVSEATGEDLKPIMHKLTRKDTEELAKLPQDLQKEVVSELKTKGNGKVAVRAAKVKVRNAAVDAVQSAIDVKVEKEIEVHPGDVWQLGAHRLYCMDSSEWEPEQRAKLAFADPPYNVNVADWDTDFQWRHDWLQDHADFVVVTPGTSNIQSFLSNTVMRYRWLLTCGLPGVYGRKSSIGTSNVLIGLLFSDLDSVHLGISDYFSQSFNQDEKMQSAHPGRKPSEFMAWLIESFTSKGNLVIDPFLGSGTTLLAAEKLGRVCHGCEINPKYCAEIIARWEELANSKAKLLR